MPTYGVKSRSCRGPTCPPGSWADGVVSSFAGNGLILTSAKIDHGNSGGLAVDRNGCFMGIPSAANKGEFESLGIIISPDLPQELITLMPQSAL